jgi:hypothetical protein
MGHIPFSSLNRDMRLPWVTALVVPLFYAVIRLDGKRLWMTILSAIVFVAAGVAAFTYSFRDPKMAYEQEVGYVEKAEKKDAFSAENYAQKKSTFGLIVFKSKTDLDPLDVYLAYAQRWEIETMFYLFKNIIDRDTVNVHNDYRTYATEFINFLSVIITSRVKREIVKKEIDKNYSYKQVFKYLSKYKKVRIKEGGDWMDVTMLKYIEEMVQKLNV